MPVDAVGKALMIASVLLVLIVEIAQFRRGGRRGSHLTGSTQTGQTRQGHRQCGRAAQFTERRFGLVADPAQLNAVTKPS